MIRFETLAKWMEEIRFKEGGQEYPNLDCYGFCRFVLQDQLNVSLPPIKALYNDRYSTTKQWMGKLGRELKDGEPAHFGDMVFIDQGEDRPIHMGIFLTPHEVFHCAEGLGVTRLRLFQAHLSQKKLYTYRPYNTLCPVSLSVSGPVSSTLAGNGESDCA